jgi:DNA-binding NarL/FixJ family response regulator
MTLRCVIVDDNQAVVAAAADLLESQGVVIVGAARSGEDAIRVVGDLDPDVVLVDIVLGPESGFEVTRTLVENLEATACRTILISTHDEVDFKDLIAESPAIGFLSKADLSAAAIRRILKSRGCPRDATEPRGT